MRDVGHHSLHIIMSYTYKITILGMPMDNSECPPAIIYALFPGYAGEPCELSNKDCTVTFDTEQTPTDLGPLVKVELI
jgi:hypothetical protein